MIGDLRQIDLDAARRLRHQLLRPGRPADELVFPGDDEPDSLHLGAFEEERLVGIATVIREPPPGEGGDRAWRVRGMATLPEVRGRGYGGLLLERCVEHAVNHGGAVLWCNARAGAVGFYRRFGFVTQGDVFDIPDLGDHYLMSRTLS
jgi:GNAT superfamily N-acetyltransferase